MQLLFEGRELASNGKETNKFAEFLVKHTIIRIFSAGTPDSLSFLLTFLFFIFVTIQAHNFFASSKRSFDFLSNFFIMPQLFSAPPLLKWCFCHCIIITKYNVCNYIL